MIVWAVLSLILCQPTESVLQPENNVTYESNRFIYLFKFRLRVIQIIYCAGEARGGYGGGYGGHGGGYEDDYGYGGSSYGGGHGHGTISMDPVSVLGLLSLGEPDALYNLVDKLTLDF